jgi:hypothetical protein
MKEKIRVEIMKVFDQEADVDTVVDNILLLFNAEKQDEQLFCEDHMPKRKYDWQKGVCLTCANNIIKKT